MGCFVVSCAVHSTNRLWLSGCRRGWYGLQYRWRLRRAGADTEQRIDAPVFLFFNSRARLLDLLV